MAGSNEIKTELDLRPLGAQQAKTDPGTGPVAPPSGGTGTAPGLPAVAGPGSTKPPVAAPRAGTVDSMGRVVVQSKRRRVKLAPPPKKLDLDVAVYGENNFYAGFDNKIATGGLFVSSLETLPVGHELDLDVNLEGTHLKVKARVDWIRVDNFSNSDCTAGAGFKLVGLSAAQVSQIEAFFAKRAPMFFMPV